MKTVICDIDGTIALRGQRGPFEYDRVLEDEPNVPVLELLNLLATNGIFIVFVSGREEIVRQDTEKFIETYFDHDFKLHMRPSGDYTPDDQLKLRIFQEGIAGKCEVLFVLDDRNRTVQMWRERANLTVFQVAEGDF